MDLNKASFYERLAISCNITDIKTIQRYTFGLVDLIKKELYFNEEIAIPGLGAFVLTKCKARRSKCVGTDEMITIPEKRRMFFRPLYYIKEYFNK